MLEFMRTFVFTVVLASGLCAAFELRAEIVTNVPTPDLKALLPLVLERAKTEGQNDRMFKESYRYERTKVTEFRNAKGEVKTKMEKGGLHIPAALANTNELPISLPPVAGSSAADDSSRPVSETHTKFKGKAFEKSDFPLTGEMLARFEYKMVGHENVNGRSAWVVDFKPAKGDLPEKSIKDKFINKAAGRVWVDAEDHAMVKADLFLSEPVNVAGGLVGAVKKFTCAILRERTPEGLWYVCDTNWHLEGREVFFRRIVDYHEESKDVQRVVSW
jgi:hypothetical protein